MGTSNSPQMIELQHKRITVSPQIHKRTSTASIMWSVSACLLPAAVWGVYVFGLEALIVLIVTIFSSVAFELIISLLTGRVTIQDGSAFLTGLLIGFNLPPSVPLYIPVIAALFAIAVVKWTFGGLGGNWMNPALAGRVFVFFSWTGHMTNWKMPRTLPIIDAVTAATPLSSIKSGLFNYTGTARGPMQFLSESNFPHSVLDDRVTGWLNGLFKSGGTDMEGGYFDLFVGNIPGCIGEVSAALLLAGTVYLFIRKIITWHIPLSYLATFGLLAWAFGGFQFDEGLFTGDLLFNLLSGGLILGAFYMATDMVTSPLTKKGMLIFGAGVGFLTFLIRFYGSFPEGVSLAILLMNIFVSLIDRYTGPSRFGISKKRVKE